MQWPLPSGELYENFGKRRAWIRNLPSLRNDTYTDGFARGLMAKCLLRFRAAETIGKLFCFSLSESSIPRFRRDASCTLCGGQRRKWFIRFAPNSAKSGNADASSFRKGGNLSRQILTRFRNRFSFFYALTVFFFFVARERYVRARELNAVELYKFDRNFAVTTIENLGERCPFTIADVIHDYWSIPGARKERREEGWRLTRSRDNFLD